MQRTIFKACVRPKAPFWVAAAALFCLPACVENARNAIPFLPPSKYVDVGGRKLTRAEVAYYQKIKDLSYATKVNPRDAVAYNGLGGLFQKKGNYSLAKELYIKAIEIDDTLSEARHNMGLICIYEERYTEALDHLEKARTLSPDDARIRHRLGQAKAGLGKNPEALKEYDEAVALDAEYTPAYLEKARLLYSMRRYADASAACRKALANIPKEVATIAKETRGNRIIDKILPTPDDEEEAPKTFRQEASFDLALCLKAQGLFREALAALVQAEDAPVARADVQVLKARLLDASGDTAGALATLQAARDAFPLKAEIPKRMAKLYQKSGQADLAAKTRLAAAELDHSDRELQEEAARNAESSKDYARVISIYERLVRVDPEDVRYRRQLAKAYDSFGIKRQAALTYQEIVNRAPDDFATRRRLGMLYSELPGFQGRAMIQFKAVLAKNPADAEVHRRMGELFLATNNFNEAEKHIKDALTAAPRDAQSLRNLGNLYREQKRFEDAVTSYNKALAIDPKLTDAQLNLAKVLLGQSRREEAVAPLQQYLKIKPLDEEARLILANTLRSLDRKEEAIQEYEAAVALRPNQAEASLSLAQLQSSLGKQKSAAGIYETILEKNPANADALREAGRLYAELGMPLRSIYCWQRLLALRPGDLEGQTRLAAAYHQIGSEEAAIKSYEAVGRSGNADAWKSAAHLHLKRKETEPAMQAYREAIKINNQDVDSRRALGPLLLAGGKPEHKDEALKLYEEVLQLAPADHRARLNRANLLSEANRMAEAQDEYEAILRDKPDYTAALVGLGVLWRKRGKYDKALEAYQKAVALDPKLQTAHYNLALIYDYYLVDAAKAKFHYGQYIDLGGDPGKLPDEAGPAERSPRKGKAESAPAKPPTETSSK